MTDIAVTRHF